MKGTYEGLPIITLFADRLKLAGLITFSVAGVSSLLALMGVPKTAAVFAFVAAFVLSASAPLAGRSHLQRGLKAPAHASTARRLVIIIIGVVGLPAIACAIVFFLIGSVGLSIASVEVSKPIGILLTLDALLLAVTLLIYLCEISTRFPISGEKSTSSSLVNEFSGQGFASQEEAEAAGLLKALAKQAREDLWHFLLLLALSIALVGTLIAAVPDRATIGASFIVASSFLIFLARFASRLFKHWNLVRYQSIEIRLLQAKGGLDHLKHAMSDVDDVRPRSPSLATRTLWFLLELANVPLRVEKRRPPLANVGPEPTAGRSERESHGRPESRETNGEPKPEGPQEDA